jgi:hypothetical protein
MGALPAGTGVETIPPVPIFISDDDRKRVCRMSEVEPENTDSKPTSAGGMFLRILVAVAVLAGIGGIIWYMNR